MLHIILRVFFACHAYTKIINTRSPTIPAVKIKMCYINTYVKSDCEPTILHFSDSKIRKGHENTCDPMDSKHSLHTSKSIGIGV